MQFRPVQADALLSAADTSRVTNLAAIADSLDYLADMIQGAVLEYDVGPLDQEKSMTPRHKLRSVEMVHVPVSRGRAAMLIGLDDLVDRLASSPFH